MKKRNRLEDALFILVLFCFVDISVSLPRRLYRGDEDSDPQVPAFVSKVEVTAFSEATANGVRREGIDTALRKYAFMALLHARTGIIYNVPLPPFLDGILCQAMRVRAGSAHKRGISFNEFTIPRGMLVQTGGPFVIIVYRRVFNFTLYTAPPGYAFASPTVGIVIYTNLNTTLDHLPLPEMTILSPNSTMTAKFNLSFQAAKLAHGASPPLRCAYFDINGTASIASISVYPNICSFKVLKDVAILIPESSSIRVSPAPSPAVHALLPSTSHNASRKWEFVLLVIAALLVAMAILMFVVVKALRILNECEAVRMKELPDHEEKLQTSLIGHTRAPTASIVRTRPVLETESLRT
ncbi:hypothetical protein KP509_19G034300 [Ceratopteris richardii]|uniref:Transmembrane protein n=1 Tax=Ceratopteris richardii TaxID=49495 RepID=A0A8T2SND8_CERRI|nr:hypothetical protein KP509_19G034300 [Ceratopteris richardii]